MFSRCRRARAPAGETCGIHKAPRKGAWMKLIIAIIKPFKLDEVREALTSLRRGRHDRHRSQRLRAAEGPHRNLSRRRICGEFPPQTAPRDRSARPIEADRVMEAISGRRQEPARSATAKSSSRRSSRPCASAPARPTATRFKHQRKSGGNVMMSGVMPRACACSRRRVCNCRRDAGLRPKMPRSAPRSIRADTAWMIAATALVLMMTIPGLALFYAGMVRKKNVLATMAQSLAATALVSILWVALGYTLGLHRRRRRCSARSTALLLRGMGMDAISPLAQDDPRSTVHALPDDLRRHHGARWLPARSPTACGFPPSCCLRAVAARRLCADRPLGLGRRLSRQRRGARFRRRHRGASQCRHRRSGRRAGAGARRGYGAKISRRTICRWRSSAPACCGSAGSASTAARRWPRIRAPCWRSSRRISPPAPAR